MRKNVTIWLGKSPPEDFPPPVIDDDPGCTAFFPIDEAESQAPEGAEFLTSVSWSFAPGSERRVGYFIAQVEHLSWKWILWAFNYSDNSMSWSWAPVAGTTDDLGSHDNAGAALLEETWKWEKAEWRTETIGEAEGGLLDDDETYELSNRILL
jgi:hypothetical protein